MIQSFVEAAVRCEKALVFTVLIMLPIPISSANLGTKTNRRNMNGVVTFGGEVVLRDIIVGIRAQTKPGFLISVRISPIIRDWNQHRRQH